MVTKLNKGKTMEKRKMLALIVAFAMIFTTAPSVAFAAGGTGPDEWVPDPNVQMDTYEWGNGETEAERESDVVYEYYGTKADAKGKIDQIERINWIRFKEGGYRDIQFDDVEDWTGKVIDDKAMEALVRHSMDNWIRLASEIYYSESETGGSGFSGVTWNGPMYTWGKYFRGNDEQKGEINLVDWLADYDKNKKTDVLRSVPSEHVVTTTWGVNHTGIRQAKKLSDVRDEMVRGISALSKKVKSPGEIDPNQIYKQRSSQGDQNGVLSSMKSTKETDVFYTIVNHQVYEAAEGSTFYNSYAVCMYDFSLEPISAQGLDYPTVKEKITGRVEGPMSETWTVYNQTTTAGTQHEEMTIGESEELNSSTTKSTEWTWGGEVGGEFQVDIGAHNKWPVGGHVQFNSKGDFHNAQTNGFTQGKSEAHHGEGKQVIDIPLLPHTGKSVKQGDEQVNGYVDYDCPVAVRYKVAIVSIGGSHNVLTNSIHTPVDYSTFFTGDISEGGVDAVTNLFKRWDRRDAGDPYGTTEGWYKGDKLVGEVHWTKSNFNESETTLNGDSKRTDTVIGELSTSAPFISSGAKMVIEDHEYYHDVGDHMPMYQLTDVKLDESIKNKTFKMNSGDTYPLDSLKVAGFDRDGVPYYGFRPEEGTWKEVYEDGSPVSDEDSVLEFSRNPATGVIYITAKDVASKTPTYLMWEMNAKDSEGKNLEYYSIVDEVTVSSTKNPPKYPFIEIDVSPKAAIHSVRFTPGTPTEASTYEGEKLNLFSTFPADACDEDEMVLSHAVSYEFNDTTVDDASIDDEGNFIAEPKDKSRSYEIRAYYMDGKNKIRTKDTAKIVVSPRKYLQPETKKGYGAIRADGRPAAFHIPSHIILKDQYGNDWDGEQPALEYDLNESTDENNAKIKRDSLIASAPGTYVVDVKEKGSPDTLCDVVFVVKKEGTVAKPEAVSGLVYNGEEQTGVMEAAEYTLEDNKATNAGTYKAKATLASYSFVWEDGSRDPVTVEYSINKASNPLEVKGKTAKVKYKKLKKKSQSLAASKVISVTKKGQGKLTYKKSTVTYSKPKSVKMSKEALKKYRKQVAKKITIDTKTGKVTVKKGAKKGTYTVKANVKAAGNGNYKSITKTVTFKIQVK